MRVCPCARRVATHADGSAYFSGIKIRLEVEGCFCRGGVVLAEKKCARSSNPDGRNFFAGLIILINFVIT